jgi:hypothetical protein
MAVQESPVRVAPRAPVAPPRHHPGAKKRLIPRQGSIMPDSRRGDSMPDILTDLVRPVPSIVPGHRPVSAISDDECLIRLAQAVEAQDSARLDEVARLIGRLAVTIE